MNTDTPESLTACYDDEHGDPCVPLAIAIKIERERDKWKAKFIQQNKDLGCEQMDPNGTIWDYAKKVQSEILTVTNERDEARGQAAMWKSNHDNQVSLKAMLMDRPDLGDRASRIAELIRERDEARGQRDRLAEALKQCREDSDEALKSLFCDALQSLTTNETISNQ